jgi:integrase
MRTVLTEKFIASPSRIPPPGQRVDHLDALVPGLALRVTDKDKRSWVLIAYYPRGRKLIRTRKLLGHWPPMSLAEARNKARIWYALLQRGIDPAVEEARQKRANIDKAACTFASAARDYLAHMQRRGMKKVDDTRRLIDRYLISVWGEMAVAEITKRDCRSVVQALVDAGKNGQARNVLGVMKTMFGWMEWGEEYGLVSSPCAKLRAHDLGIDSTARDRILTNDETRAVWNAADEIGYPDGALVKMLFLTGQRRTEVGEMKWSEINLEEGFWVHDSKNGDRVVVPLAPMAKGVLESLPRWQGSDWVFSNDGKIAINSYARLKKRIDAKADVKDPWTLHDARRTMRTGLSALPIEQHIRELMIGHRQQGIKKVYDLHSYHDEKLNGFRLWEARLWKIVHPQDADVVNITA